MHQDDDVTHDDEGILHDIWTVYFHDPADTRWTLESYRRLFDVSSTDDFWRMHHASAPLVPLGMFFIMREDVFPCWDDAKNIQGGSMSIKVANSDVRSIWETLTMRVMGETLTKRPEDSSSINGISISPKRGFCIIKFWTKDHRFADKPRDHLEIPRSYGGEIIYRKNIENIQNDANAKQRVQGTSVTTRTQIAKSMTDSARMPRSPSSRYRKSLQDCTV